MEKLGYVVSEAPVLFLIIWFAVRLVQYRRYRNKQPIYSERDAALLYPKTNFSLRAPKCRVRLARCILLATAAIYVEFLLLAPFGAAILCTSLMLTTTALVHNFILSSD